MRVICTPMQAPSAGDRMFTRQLIDMVEHIWISGFVFFVQRRMEPARVRRHRRCFISSACWLCSARQCRYTVVGWWLSYLCIATKCTSKVFWRVCELLVTPVTAQLERGRHIGVFAAVKQGSWGMVELVTGTQHRPLSLMLPVTSSTYRRDTIIHAWCAQTEVPSALERR